MVAHTIVRQDVSVVKASIWSVRCRTLLRKAFNRVGRANGTMHDQWKIIVGQKMLFVFTEAAYRFGITLLILRFECSHIEHGVFFLLLLEDP
jgi:hypothetical protein